jgi:heme-degrading monooxygenase HmoA
MTVLMTMRMPADGTQLEKFAADNPTIFSEVIEMAKGHGLIAHRFYASADELLVVDRWPDEASFNAFMGDANEKIQQIMASSGVSGEPQTMFWRELTIGDEVG